MKQSFQFGHSFSRILGSLEELGYLVRSDDPSEGRARIVKFTKRGNAASIKAIEFLYQIEKEWRAELGAIDFTQLKEVLFRVWESPLVR